MSTSVINTAHGGRADVDIMRPSKWGNPFVIGRDGDRATCILKYRKYIETRPDLLKAIVPELTNKVLGCTCVPQACHGDYLCHLANNPEKVEELQQAHALAAALGFASKKPAGEPELLSLDTPEVKMFMAPRPKARGKIAVQPDEVFEELAPPSAEQEAVLQAIMVAMEGEVHLLVGRAGAGKSHVIKHLARRVPITVCATTAKAALLVKGLTLDRLFCYSREHNACWDAQKLEKQMRASAQIIVIDEASMAGEKMADYIYNVARTHGKILVLVGDWAQASPVDDKWFFGTKLYANAKIHHLTESHRQNEKNFLAALDALRCGKRTSPHYDVFKPCILTSENEIAGDPSYTRVAATNREVDQYNQLQMNKIIKRHPDVFLDAFAVDLREAKYKERYPRKPGFYSGKVKDSPMAHGESFRLGSRVMITLNLHQSGYVNGDIGMLIDAKLKKDRDYRYDLGRPGIGQPYWDAARADDAPSLAPKKLNGDPPPPQFWASQYSEGIYGIDCDLVECLVLKMQRTGEVFFMSRSVLESSDPGQDAHTSVIGFPLTLAWSVTIHKVQGATLDKVYVKMESVLRMRTEESRHGLAYVALSRCRTLAGLKISQWEPQSIHCDPECLCLIDPECEQAVELERQRRQKRLAEQEKWNLSALGTCDSCGRDMKRVQFCACGRTICRDCATVVFPEKCPRCTSGAEDSIYQEAL